MQIFINDTAHEVPDGISVVQLLTQMLLPPQRLAVEINQEIVPRSELHTRHLCAEDRVEIVHAVGGG